MESKRKRNINKYPQQEHSTRERVNNPQPSNFLEVIYFTQLTGIWALTVYFALDLELLANFEIHLSWGSFCTFNWFMRSVR